MFRRTNETTQVIKLIDTQGNTNYVQQHGQMSLTKPTKVVVFSEERALCYCRSCQEVVNKDITLFNKTIANTGTVSREGLTDSDNSLQGIESIIAQAITLENEEISLSSDDILLDRLRSQKQ